MFKIRGWCRTVDCTSTLSPLPTGNLDSGAVWQFVDFGNKSDMLQLRVEIGVTPANLETHFLARGRFENCIDKRGNNWDCLLKMKCYIGRYCYLDICWHTISCPFKWISYIFKDCNPFFNTRCTLCTCITVTCLSASRDSNRSGNSDTNRSLKF
jgi:hypothetical protein